MDPAELTAGELYRDHLTSLGILRHAKNIFFWLAAVAIVLHLLSWVIVAYTDVLRPLSPTTVTILGPDGTPAAVPTEAQLATARRWEQALQSALLLGGFVGRASALAFAGIMLTALLVALSARLGGAADLTRGCVWSLVALAMLVPWLRAPDELIGAISALGSMEDFGMTLAQRTGSIDSVVALLRYLVTPALVLIFLVFAALNFHNAHMRITAVPGAKLPIHEV